MRTLFVSNRLPVVIEKSADVWTFHASSGGLVTALSPLLKRRGGIWIGWPGASDIAPDELDAVLHQFALREGYRLAPVPLSAQDYHRFYQGFCNEIIWPLFHDLQSLCNFVPAYWTSAQKVEQSFADVIEQHAQPDDLIWVQDYQLMGLGRTLVQRGLKNRLAFFLHIPFPPPDIFLKLPWRMDVLRGLLEYEVIGFQTRRDLANFSDCVHRLLPEVERHRDPGELRLETDGRQCAAAAFPIGIDFDEFAAGAADPAVDQRLQELRAQFGGRQVILGVDRLDYTKGIPYRLRAFAQALETFPELHRNVTLLQILVPSREQVPQYQKLKGEIEQLVAQINGRFTQPGWVPIHHFFRHIPRQELLAFYRLADVALVTPLKDGMNLVCKEYCAAQIEGNGVLVLSEFAGASEQLAPWAINVNPYDIENVAAAIHRALLMTIPQRRRAMVQLRDTIREQNVYWWLNQFLAECGLIEAEREKASRARAVPPAPQPAHRSPRRKESPNDSAGS
ncbi:MAG TPA: trehalose-6-phosphate synthase [Phycisphaerae bacterium]|nr:trehalose-6-phosphate synthase [Phycisphaerae bacterium]